MTGALRERSVRSGTGGPLGLLAAALMVGTFASTIANTLVNVPLAVITADLGAPLTSGTLIVVAFNLTCAVGLPFAGWLGDRLGRRRVFLASMVGVTIGALGAATAPTLPLLVIFRLVQGFSGALVLPTVLALITTAVGPERRGRAVSWWAAANGAGQAAGPTVGGILTDAFGWRAVFIAIVPFAVSAFAGGWRWIPQTAPRAVPLDLPGACSLALGVTLVLVSASVLGAAGPGSLLAWGGIGLAAAVLGAFVVIERRRAEPFVPPKLLAEPRFVRSAVAALCQMFCLTATLLTIPLYVTAHWGFSSRAAGLLVVALPLAMTLLAPVAGLLTERWSPRQALRIGLICLGLAEAVLAVVLAVGGSGAGPMWTIVAVATCIGAGMALTQTPAAAGASRSAQDAGSGTGLGVFNMLRFVGAAMGGAIVAIILGDSPDGAGSFATMAGVCGGTALLALLVTFAGRVPR
ncbi:MFS transporter [Amycolatopsis taiwanensis]|uniref:MFS transporter n=1 Tax=Amycolatopsis taiwanensis TaxID=342230 RepID=UPI0004B92FDB|nr:MFS transporter [Amycolatopsis taiwanensis]